MKKEPSLTLPPDDNCPLKFEENVRFMAAHHDNIIEPGHGFFFDFSDVPEYEKYVLDYLVTFYGWTLEKTFFIRKPNN